jgi:hypothetical protein
MLGKICTDKIYHALASHMMQDVAQNKQLIRQKCSEHQVYYSPNCRDGPSYEEQPLQILPRTRPMEPVERRWRCGNMLAGHTRKGDVLYTRKQKDATYAANGFQWKNDDTGTFQRLGIRESNSGNNILQPMAVHLENKNLSPIHHTPPDNRHNIQDVKGNDVDMELISRKFPFASEECQMPRNNEQEIIDFIPMQKRISFPARARQTLTNLVRYISPSPAVLAADIRQQNPKVFKPSKENKCSVESPVENVNDSLMSCKALDTVNEIVEKIGSKDHVATKLDKSHQSDGTSEMTKLEHQASTSNAIVPNHIPKLKLPPSDATSTPKALNSSAEKPKNKANGDAEKSSNTMSNERRYGDSGHTALSPIIQKQQQRLLKEKDVSYKNVLLKSHQNGNAPHNNNDNNGTISTLLPKSPVEHLPNNQTNHDSIANETQNMAFEGDIIAKRLLSPSPITSTHKSHKRCKECKQIVPEMINPCKTCAERQIAEALPHRTPSFHERMKNAKGRTKMPESNFLSPAMANSEFD